MLKEKRRTRHYISLPFKGSYSVFGVLIGNTCITQKFWNRYFVIPWYSKNNLNSMDM